MLNDDVPWPISNAEGDDVPPTQGRESGSG